MTITTNTNHWEGEDSLQLEVPTPFTDATSRICNLASYSLYDPKSDKPLPVQIYEGAVLRTEAEEAQTAGSMIRVQERRASVQGNEMKAAYERMAMFRFPYLDATQKIRYEQAEAYMLEGDVDAATEGLIQAAALDTITCVHTDKDVAQEINDLFENTGMAQHLLETGSSYEHFGNAFPVQLWKAGRYYGTTVLNPKNVPVAKSLGMSQEQLLIRPSKAAIHEFERMTSANLFYHALSHDWNEWMEVNFQAIPLNPDFVVAVKNVNLPFMRYGIPRKSKAAKPISTRQVLEEMQRATIEGVKNQIIVITIANPSPKKMQHLNALISQNRSDRVMSFVWEDGLKVQSIMPASIDELLATDFAVNNTYHIFRNLGIPLTITGNAPADMRLSEEEAKQNLAMLLLRANEIQQKVKRTFLAKWIWNYNRYNPGVNLSLGDFAFVPTAIDAAYRIQQMVQALATFGLISVQTAMTWAGLSYDKEMQRILVESETGVRNLIFPFSSFGQTAGEESETESISKPGRTPDRMNPA